VASINDTTAVEGAASFAMGFVSSDAFKALFKEGMTLVEDAAAYLDGRGREQSKTLHRMAALAYASESMRLTTRLMQIASWLLLQRAVVEGELTSAQASTEKNRVNIRTDNQPTSPESLAELPEDIRELVARSLRLQARIAHLDQLLTGSRSAAPAEASPVAAQVQLLQSAFAHLSAPTSRGR
jgi:regulator of CtrA degradation